MSSTITISEPHLRHNVSAARRVLGETELLAVIKADAYGHGAEVCAPLFARAGVSWLGVTDAEEGVRVRGSLQAAGIAEGPRILVMTAPPGGRDAGRIAARLAIEHGLTPVVSALEQLGPLAEMVGATPHSLPIHLEIDSGLSRQGVPGGPMLDVFLAALKKLPKLRLDGLCTHLASAECGDAMQTVDQFASFERACGQMHYADLLPPWIHVGNTSMLDNASPAAEPMLLRLRELAAVRAQAMARCGLGLYGYSLPLEPNVPVNARLRAGLKPVLSWTTTVTAIEEVPARTRIGYGGTFTARRPMRLALLPVGYADGLRRGLSSTNDRAGGWVMVKGHRAPIVGRVSMNLTTVDVTGLECGPGTVVTLLGEGCTAEDHARVSECLPYEILCGLRATRREVLMG